MSDGPEASGGDADSMRERARASAPKLWVLVGADRWVIAFGIAAFLFASILLIDAVHPVGSVALLRTGDPVETLFQALAGAIITGVTLVVTLNQLVLSQELGAVGDQRERMDGALSFRRDAEDVLEPAVAPAEPATFLRALLDASADRAAALAEAVADADASAAFSEAVSSYASSVRANATAVASDLEGAEFGTFDVVFAALDYNYSWKIFAARRIRATYEEECTAEVTAAFDELDRVLELFGTAREHFKTLYFQWELVNLSRAILYAAVPALAASASMIVFFESSAAFVASEAFGVTTGVALVAAATAVAVFPFAILVSYILRIATVTKRTLSIGPFVLRETDRSGELEDAPE